MAIHELLELRLELLDVSDLLRRVGHRLGLRALQALARRGFRGLLLGFLLLEQQRALRLGEALHFARAVLSDLFDRRVLGLLGIALRTRGRVKRGSRAVTRAVVVKARGRVAHLELRDLELARRDLLLEHVGGRLLLFCVVLLLFDLLLEVRLHGLVIVLGAL